MATENIYQRLAAIAKKWPNLFLPQQGPNLMGPGHGDKNNIIHRQQCPG